MTNPRPFSRPAGVLLLTVIGYALIGVRAWADTPATPGEPRARAEALVADVAARAARGEDPVSLKPKLLQAVDVDPTFAAPHVHLARVAEREEDWAEAITRYQRFCQLAGETPDAARAKARVERVRQYAELDKTPEGKRARRYDFALNAARRAADAGDPSQAMERTAAAIATDDRRWEAYVVRAMALIGLGRLADAQADLHKAVQYAPADEQPALRDAVAACERQRSANGLAEAAARSVQARDYAAAASSFARAFELAPDQERWGMAAGVCYAVSGRPNLARPYFERLAASTDSGTAARAKSQLAALAVPPAGTAEQRAATRAVNQSGAALAVFGFDFIAVAPGSFTMGSAAAETGARDDEEQHRVTFTRGFEMTATEVTRRQWIAAMSSRPWSRLSGSAGAQEGDELPAAGVTWAEANDFCTRLSALDPAAVYRLPTEAEWEYACRAGSTGLFGLKLADAKLPPEKLPLYFWFESNRGFVGDDGPAPVGRKRSNQWGFYDMHGNLWEWCADWYGRYASRTISDPTGPPAGPRRVLRGGSWRSQLMSCRSAQRDSADPDDRRDDVGFRIVRQRRDGPEP